MIVAGGAWKAPRIAELPMRLIDLFWKNERGTMVADIAKATAVIAFLSVIAANFVSTRTAELDRDRLAEVASAATRGNGFDPLVTGSLRKAANETRLDPCVVKR
jgi:hypothetical protein